MKTNMISKKVLFIAIVMLFSCLMHTLSAQNNPTKEILVYFTSGVQRVSKGLTVSTASPTVRSKLAHFNINEEKITSAFPDFNEADTIKTTSEGRTIGLPNMTKIFRIQIPDGIARQSVIDSLRKLPNVLFAELNGFAAPHIIPNDQYFSSQWALQGGGGMGRIQAPEAWDITTGNSNNIIGIVDGGIDPTHPDLSGKVSGDANWGWGGHGIHVAGIASAKTNNTTGVAGVDWNAQLHAQRVDNTDDVGTYQAVVDAVNYSSAVHVFNNSWGLTNPDGSGGRYSTTVRMAFAYAYKMNRTAVVSMGNNNGSQTQYPAGFGQGIIAVGATDASDAVAGFSDIGNHIAVSAPGVSIYSTYRNPDYQYLSGTSMAAPVVTGIASLLKGYNPDLYNDDIEHIIQLSADKVRTDLYTYDANGWNINMGYGRVNARKALDRLRLPYEVNHLISYGGTDQGASSLSTMVIWGAPNLADGVYLVKRHEVQKSITFPEMQNFSVWGRGVETIGWADNGGVNYTMGWCNAIPGTVTSTNAILRTYVYEVFAIDGSLIGWFPCEPSQVQFAYTVHGRREIASPTSLIANALSATSIRLSWQDNSNNEYAFTIERSTDGVNFSPIGEIVTNGNGTGTRTYDDNGLQQNVTYYYRVRGYAQEFTSNYSLTASETIPALQSVTNLSAEGQPMHVKLTWSGVPNAEGYRIYRNGISVGTTINATFWDEVPSYNVTYTYEVRSYYHSYEVPGPTINGKALHLASSTPNPTANNNQRKMVLDAGGVYHMVYESAGDIWYTKSNDGGTTWINEATINDHNQGGNPRNPSLSQFTQNGINYLQAVWIQDAYGYATVKFRECVNGVWSSMIDNSSIGVVNPGYNMKPIVEQGWVAYDYFDSTYGIAILKHDSAGFRTDPLLLPSGQGKQPAIYVNPSANNKAQVVYEDPSTGSIRHWVCEYNDYAHSLSWLGTPTNISSTAGRTSNCNPSFAGSFTTMYAAWQGYDSTTGKTEIIVRRGKDETGYYYWYENVCFSSNQTCNSTANFSQPSIRFIGANNFGVTWQSSDKKLFTAAVTNNSVYSLAKLTSINANYPLLCEHTDGATMRIVYTKDAASAPYQLLFDQTNLVIPYLAPPVPYNPPNGQQNVGLGAWLGWNCVLGASTYDVQVSTTNGVNFASGIFRDQTGITITGYQPLGLTYDTWYYWRVRANIGVWTSDWSDIWSFKTYPYSPPSCPYVFAKRGEDFVIDNNILPQSEYAGNKDKTVTDYYKLLAAPALENGKYTLELREFERERSKLDQLKLLAVDHTLNTDIAVLPDGKIVEYIPAFRLIDDKSNEIMPKLETMEGDAYVTSRGDQFTLKFEPTLAGYSSLENQEGGVLLGGWVVHEGRTPSQIIDPKKQSVGVVGSRGVVGANSSFTFRERGTMVYVPLGKFEDQINVSFTDKVAFDFASLVVKVPTETYKVQELNLTEAKHSKMGNVTSLLSTNDGATEELYPGETIRLTFQALPVEEGKTRSFILMSEGRYERIREGESLTRIPDEFQLKQSYPNPFNPQTTIRYELSSAGHVTITIYDVLGQEVTKMVNETQEAGYYEKVWDAGNTPSGIYYVRLTVADPFGKQLYQATNKLVVMK